MKLIETTEGRNPILELSEFDVHDVFASAHMNLFGECGMSDDDRADLQDTCGCFERITIVPERTKDFPPALVEKWEQRLNELRELLHKFDAEVHEDAEYTC